MSKKKDKAVSFYTDDQGKRRPVTKRHGRTKRTKKESNITPEQEQRQEEIASEIEQKGTVFVMRPEEFIEFCVLTNRLDPESAEQLAKEIKASNTEYVYLSHIPSSGTTVTSSESELNSGQGTPLARELDRDEIKYLCHIETKRAEPVSAAVPK